jgi:predicted P-loop ATPase
MTQRKLSDTKTNTSSIDRVQLVQDFLALHYDVKMNVFDPTRIVIVAKNAKRYKQNPNFNDISLHMESEGIRGCDSILKKILNSPNQVTTFNPVQDYFNALDGKWKGESHIDKYCSHIIARDFGDKDGSYYQDRFKRIFKKWLAASVACSLGVRQNDVMIGFVHADEGIGKTYALEFLMPSVLKDFYAKSDKDERLFNATTAFTQNFIVNFDEFVGITKNSAESIKKLLSSIWITITKSVTNNFQRIANATFTSNKTSELGGFLTYEMGYRRYAVIELDNITHGYSAEVDIDQLWAEAYVLYKNANFDYEWNMDDFIEFREYNSRYIIETNAQKLIKKYYRLPEPEEESEFKMPMDILQELQKAKKLNNSITNVSDITIGMALKNLGFKREAKRISKNQTRYGYNVISLIE